MFFPKKLKKLTLSLFSALGDMIFLLAVQAFEVILRYDFALSKTAKSCQSSLLSSLMKYLSMTRESVAHFALACSPGRSKVRVS